MLSYLGHLGASRNYGLTENGLRLWMRERPVLLFLDGLDEVLDTNSRREVQDEAASFAAAHDRAFVIMTSRIHGYVPDRLRNAGFEHLTLDELQEDERADFVNRWFALATADPEQVAARADRVHRGLGHSGSLRSICGNPLLLTMACLVARSRDLPRDRWGLYESMMRTLVHRWDFNRLGDLEIIPGVILHDDEKLALLRVVGRTMAEDTDVLTANVVGEARLRGIAELHLQNELHLPPDRARATADALLAQLRERNFVLCLQGPGLWGFMHRTFLEWSIAADIAYRFTETRELSEDDLADLTDRHWEEPQWQEVLRLLGGRLQPPFATRMIETVVARIGADESVPRRSRKAPVFAAELLAEASAPARMHDAAYSYHRAMIRALGVNAHATCDLFSTWIILQRLPEYWTPELAGWELKFRPNSTTIDSDLLMILFEFGRIFGSKHRFSVINKDGCTENEDDVLRDLWLRSWQCVHHWPDVVKAIPQGPSADLLQRALSESHESSFFGRSMLAVAATCALVDRNEHVRNCALQALATWPFGSSAEALLLWCLRNETEDWVRASALRSVCVRRSDPRLAALLEHSVCDASAKARAAALASLQFYAPDEEAYGALLKRAVDDDAAEARAAALEALGAWIESSEVRVLLTERAVNDPSPPARAGAILGLGGAVGDESIRPFVFKRLAEDEDPAVQDAAIYALARSSGREYRIAISQDLDGVRPFLLPGTAVTAEHIARAAAKIGESPAATRERVRELIAEGFPYTLADH